MTSDLPSVPEILARLVSFPTVSRQSNLALLDYVEGLLAPAGVRLERFVSEDGTRANLLARLGPEGPGGIMLSGHCDVVPTEGQAWQSDPFMLRQDDGCYYGRGTADMKGFLAVAIRAMLKAAGAPLSLPLQLAISYDEEIGCMGVRGMLDALGTREDRPALCLIGEPTGMRIATGHKGKRALRACCHGQEGHSALAPEALNALHLGADFLIRLQARQEELRLRGAQDPDYDIPYSTIHVGVMQGGTALNIVPNHCELDFEIRNVAGDDPDEILAGIRTDAEATAAPHRNRFPHARVEVEEISGYPGLDTSAGAAVALLKEILGRADPTIKVAFGTEAGLFSDTLGVTSLVCGPGHMAQGHKPDEYVSEEQLLECAAFLDALTALLVKGDAPALCA
ncbi:acetylornithine deacetylase [Martelella endophytica]|uniref:Acetylornithine deacetylase n=1 Tax=Martelella endophytica TaxID=1486262 RepID=A0A0D5LM24_MAREN|nr:acetylornithine deacetylase [Martelella endophytica]AJY44990.1 acetylornithine deacetylase [Martelella endophytica]